MCLCVYACRRADSNMGSQAARGHNLAGLTFRGFGPRFFCIKMNISSNTLGPLKGMSENSIGSIKWGIVPMIWNKTICIRYYCFNLEQRKKSSLTSFEPTFLGKRNLDVCFFWSEVLLKVKDDTPPTLKPVSISASFTLLQSQVWGIVHNLQMRRHISV